MANLISRRQLICVTAGGLAGSLLASTSARAASGSAVYPVALPLYAPQFVAFTQGFFRQEGLDVQLVQAGSGVKMRDIVAAGQGDIGIGDVAHPLQLTNRKRPAKILSAVDLRNASTFTVSASAHASGLTDLKSLATWKRADGGKPLIGVSSIGGTAYLWSTFILEQMKLDQSVTFIPVGEADTMLGSLKSKQIDVLVASRSLTAESEKHGWGQMLFDMADHDAWASIIGGDVPVTANFALQSLLSTDPAKVQSYTNALFRATRWMHDHSTDEVYGAIEQYVGSASRESNLIELDVGRKLLNVQGLIDEATYQRGSRVWFREITGIRPLPLNAVYDGSFIEKANASVKD
jgi:NitT/TauT family transport system substrate-binding protein